MNRNYFSPALIFSLFTLLLLSCEKSDVKSASDGITGTWTNQQTIDTLNIFLKAERLLPDKYGFAFKDNGVFIERKNAGWCGTPPVTYSDFTGTWEQTDSLVYITVPYWGGTAEYVWKIMELKDQTLKLAIVSAKYTYIE